jgi:hypothetical protein
VTHPRCLVGAWIISAGMLASLTAACSESSSPAATETVTTGTITVTTTSTAPSPTPEPSMEVGWTTEQEEAAAQMYADGIQKSHSLALRLEVGHCVVDKVQKKMWPTYDEWVAARDDKSGLTSDQDKFPDEVGILGTCEFLEFGPS